MARSPHRFDPSPIPSGEAYLAAPVADLASRPALWIEPAAPVSEAARRMLDAGAGSILVRGSSEQGAGIVTDRDLRRVLAEGVGPTTPVGEIASRPLLTLGAGASVAAAHLAMLEARVHHLALLGAADGESRPDDRPEDRPDDTQIVGVISSTDLHRHHSRGPFFVLHRLDRADGSIVRDYVRYRDDAVRSLRRGGVAADRIGHIVSHLDDYLVRRCLRAEIQAVESESGPLPTHWAWVAFGSDGRREQPVLLDQHNALVFDLEGLDADAAASASEIFHRLAARVSERLRAAGWPEPEGGFVARRWCAHLAEWRRRFQHWLKEPDAESLEHAQVFFDLRHVMGPLDVSLPASLESTEPSAEFLRLMAAMAARRRPTVGRWRGLKKDGDGEIDLLTGGLRPLVALARVAGMGLGLSGSTWHVSTSERLAAAGRADLLPNADADRLAELYAWLSDRCLDLLLTSSRTGQPVATLRPGDLARHERRRLTTDLRFLRRQQSALDSHLRRFGRSRERRGEG